MSKDIECEKEKKKFYKYVKSFIFLIAVFIVLYIAYSLEKNNMKKIAVAFENNQELICDTKIVSKGKGYKYYEKDSNFITNADNMFDLSKCRIKE
jgi:hypothetical protein